MKKKLYLTLGLTTLLIGLSSCQETEVDSLQEAQLCLNTATASTARDCVSKISSFSSARANSLKCSAIFISEGFSTPADFVDALNSINQTGSCTGGCSSTVNALTSFAFSSSDVATAPGRDANNTTASEAFSVCNQSGVAAYTQISSLFKIGTLASMVAYGLSGGAPITADNIDSALTSLIGSDAATVGELVVTTYSAACSNLTDAAESTVSYCNELKTALDSGSNNTDIGSCLLKKLADPNDTCP